MATETNAAEVQPCSQAGLSGHVQVLDGVRGIAILMVLVVHFYQREVINSSYPLLGKFLGRALAPGGYGVELFFVLSGLLITGILLDTKAKPGFFGKFYMRRILRIFPLYYGALAIIFGVLPHFLAFDAGGREIAAHQVWLWTYLANWPSSYIWDNSNQFLLGHFWSLSVEEHFYMVWPALVFFCSRSTLWKLCWGILGIGIVTRAAVGWGGASAPVFLQWPTLTKVDGLAVGAMLAIALRDPTFGGWLPAGRLLSRGLGGAFALFLALALVPRTLHSVLVATLGETVIVFFFGLFVLRALRSLPGEATHRILRSGFLVAFGKYSYGIYVIHGILRPALAGWFPLDRVPAKWGLPIILHGFYYLYAVGVSFGLAYLSYHLFEKRFLSLKRHFEY